MSGLLGGRERWRGRRPLHRLGVPASFLRRGGAGIGEGDRLPVLVGQLVRRGNGGEPANEPQSPPSHAAGGAACQAPGWPESPAGTRRTRIGRAGFGTKMCSVTVPSPKSPVTTAG